MCYIERYRDKDKNVYAIYYKVQGDHGVVQ